MRPSKKHYKKSLNPLAQKCAIDLIFFGYVFRAFNHSDLSQKKIFDQFRKDCGYSIDEFSDTAANQCYNRFIQLAKQGYLKGLSRSLPDG